MSLPPELDLSDFWDDDEYFAKNYTDDPLTEDKVRAVEHSLGYRLPDSYLALMRNRNGGAPRRTVHPAPTPTSWAEDHVALTAFMSVGQAKRYGLCGENGSRFFIDEWGYPPIGVYFADCPSAGHDLLCLDYRECGAEGEPSVVHVDQEWDYKVTRLADTFGTFLLGLRMSEGPQ